MIYLYLMKNKTNMNASVFFFKKTFMVSESGTFFFSSY